ncbi:ABC-2 type transport system permease protein [Curtobacterium sp. PhB142]|nr:ABC-2 type transport system permease protein [Curtobacterium sp. PhB142]TCM01894.1 ABC-2 type transport system permease protein [Curtobacterium sp. PhB134]
MTYLNELASSRELLANLIAREVKGKYRRTLFGQLWSLINPLALMLIYTLVYSFIFRAKIEIGDPSGLNIYPLWLMCGLLPWTFFTSVVNGGMSSIVSNGSLVKKVYFPRMVLPISAMGSVGFTWLLEMGVLAVALLLFGANIWVWLPLTVALMVLLAMFAVGLSMVLAVINVHFRDMQHLVGILLRLWMYLTPIIYPISLVEDAVTPKTAWLVDLYHLNPMEHFSVAFRNLLYDNRMPAGVDILWCVIAAFGMLAIGFWVFAKNEKKLAELL